MSCNVKTVVEDMLLFKVSDYLFEVRMATQPRSPITIGDLRRFTSDGDTLKVHALDRGGTLDAVPGDDVLISGNDVV